VRGVPNANNPSDPASAAGATPPAALAHQLDGRSGAKLNRCHLGRCGMGAALADTTARATAPGTRNNRAYFEPPSDSEWEATGAPINRA